MVARTRGSMLRPVWEELYDTAKGRGAFRTCRRAGSLIKEKQSDLASAVDSGMPPTPEGHGEVSASFDAPWSASRPAKSKCKRQVDLLEGTAASSRPIIESGRPHDHH